MSKKLSATDTVESTAEQCPGHSWSWMAKYKNEPHSATNRFGRFARFASCWACGADLGCERCSGEPAELLCMKDSGRQAGGTFFGHGRIHGPVWATVTAFVKHGLFAGQKLEDYPVEYQMAHERTAGEIETGSPVKLKTMIANIGRPIQ
jgi:hypothetical protein